MSDEYDTQTNGIVRALQLADDPRHFDVHVVTPSAQSPLRRSSHCTIHCHPVSNSDELVAAASAIARDHDIDVIVPVRENMVVRVGRAADRLRNIAAVAAIPDPDLCERVDHKWTFHQMAESMGLPVPPTIGPEADLDEVAAIAASWRHGMLLKPSIAVGGLGIELFSDVRTLTEALARRRAAGESDLVVQEFVPGDDLGCSFLAIDGALIDITVQHGFLRTAGNYACSMGIEFVDDPTTVEIARQFARQTQWNGVANLDLRRDGDGDHTYLLEVNPRYWQTLMGSFAVGVNFPLDHVRLALGEQPPGRSCPTGEWLDWHAATQSRSAIRSTAGAGARAIRSIDVRTLTADPAVEITLLVDRVARMLKRFTAGQRGALRRRIRRNTPAAS
jgi:predicted ATP-grasp superfamily ATP-dependent carboligase